jgi:cytochrome P450
MIVSLAVLLYTAVLLSFIYRYVVHPLFISPLAKLPRAHPTSAILPTWLWYQVHSKNESRAIHKVHQQQGPIVLLAPNEVSVCSLEGLRKIYSGRRFKRPSWFVSSFMNFNGTPNLVTLFDTNEHARRKKTMLQVYSKSFVTRSPDLQKLAAVILFERFLPVLVEAAKNDQDIDVYELSRAIGAEIGSAYEVGLQNGLDIVRLGQEQARKQYIAQSYAKMQELAGHKQAKKWLEDNCLDMCKRADAELKEGDSKIEPGKINTYPLVYAHLDAAVTTQYPSLSTSEKLHIVASELIDNLEASREGDGIILTYAMYELSRRPEILRQLREELKAVSPRFLVSSANTGPFDTDILQTLDRTPVLEAIIKETMRMYAPTPGPQRRTVPAGGTTVEGFYIPANITISTAQRALHMNEDVFPNAEMWKPERWLQPSREKISEDRDPAKWWWGFGSGALSCSGKDFASIGTIFIIMNIVHFY